MQKIIFIILILTFSLGLSQDVFAWKGKITHPALSNEAVNFYNLYFDPDDFVGAGQKITDEQKEWLIQGSIDADTPPRWINHFYDPIYNQGWTGGEGTLFDVLVSVEDATSAKDWVKNQKLQTEHKLYKGNRTWQRAIYEYVKNNNEQEAFYTLGYVLHLLQDMAVPEHTRNDDHPPMNSSPLENYATRFTRDTFKIADDLNKQNYEPIILGSLEEYFDYLANYSNNYFFSKDTINDPRYENPKIVAEAAGFAFGIDKEGRNIKLAKVKLEKLGDYDFRKIYEVKDIDFVVMRGYWRRLSREAVLATAGAINLFLKEVERAKENPELLETPPEEKSAIVSLFTGDFSPIGESLRLVRVWKYLFKPLEIPKDGPLEIVKEQAETFKSIPIGGGPAGLFSPNPATPGVAGLGAEHEPPVAQFVEVQSQNDDEAQFGEVELLSPIQLSTSDVVKPPVFISRLIAIPSAPGAGAGGAVIADQTVEVQPQNDDEAQSGEVELQDETPPTINSFSTQECNNSLASTTCFIATSTISLSWQSEDEDIDFYEILIDDFLTATTTATSTTLTLSDNATSTIKVKAKDTSGNYSVATSTQVEVFTKPIIINEIAWAGATASAYDEWIELYNRSPKDIDLENWTVGAEDGAPLINLSGVISANGYYLLERKDDDTVSDITADLIYGNDGSQWALHNDGEILILAYASTTIDQTPSGGVGWPAGDSTNKYSMERYDINTWMTNNDFIKNGLDTNNNLVNGTPKAKNSVSSLLVLNKNISRNLTLKKLNSPVTVVNSSAALQNGATLSIEPGVTIKFETGTGLFVNGKILAQGTENEPIIFTSANVSPLPGDWIGVFVYGNADSDSVFDYTNFSYAGATNGAYKKALLSVENTSITVSNSIFEYSKVYGIKLVYSDSQINNNIFRNNNNGNDSAGIYSALYITLGAPIIQNNTFINNNRRGIYVANSSASISLNSFQSNGGEAIYSVGTLADFENNSGFDNAINGIVMEGNITSLNSTTTLKINSLPYVIKTYGVCVVSNSTLVIPSQTVFKANQRIEVLGNLIIDGNNSEDIVFTSLSDDTISGDTTNDATSTSPVPGQFAGINIYDSGSLTASGFTMRYGGGQGGNRGAGILVNGGLADISAAVFDNNYPYGLRVVNSNNISIQNARFVNHLYNGSWGTKAAMAIENSTTTLVNVTFENNLLGILSDTLSSFTASAISWLNNSATTSPAGLF